MKIKVKISLFLFLILLLTSATYAFIHWNSAKRSLMKGVDKKLNTAVTTIRLMLPNDYHDKILNKDSVSEEQYTDIVDRFNRICVELDLQYLWSNLQIGDDYYFTTATSPDKITKNNKHAPFFAQHNDPAAFTRAFSSMQPTYSHFYNEWGHGRMLLYPAYDAHGRKYCFGASVSIEDVNSLLRELLIDLAFISFLVLALGLAGGLLLASSFSRPIVKIAGLARDIAYEGPGREVNINGSQELCSLSESINKMSRALLEREKSSREQQRHLQQFIDHVPALIYMKDKQGRYIMVNAHYERFLTLPAGELIGKTDEEVFPIDIAQQIDRNDRQTLENNCGSDFEEHYIRDNHIYHFMSKRFTLQNSSGEVELLCGISIDITTRKEMEERLRLSRQVLETASEAVVITEPDGTIIDINPAFEYITGYNRDEVLGKDPSMMKSGRHDRAFYNNMWDSLTTEGKWEGEVWDRKKNGEIYPKWLSISSIRNRLGKISHYVAIFQDISDKKHAEEKLTSLAFYDPLTELPNRTLFKEHLNHDLKLAARKNDKHVLLFIDLDRFKNVNDTLGHSYGDMLLQAVSKRLQSILRKCDMISRLGGDEFTVSAPVQNNIDNISTLISKIQDSLRQCFVVSGKDIFIGGTIGAAIFPDDADNVEDLVRCADLAMYRAKEAGRGSFAFFTRQMDEEVARRHALESDLHSALQNREFELYYQPKISAASGRAESMEALARWNHPQKGLVSPDEFIPMAEDTDIIFPLGEWILNEACRQTKEWQDNGYPLRVAVNLSAKQFQNDDLIQTVTDALANSGLDADCLELELTESMLMHDTERVKQVIGKLNEMGIKTSIDDFGTGYSSLSYLKHLPLNALKIDRSFIMDVDTNQDDQSIVSAILSLASDLRLSVVAEGVETQAHLDFLRSKNCPVIQGYFFSRPLPADAFLEYLKKNSIPEAEEKT